MESLFCQEVISHVIDIEPVRSSVDIEPMVDQVLLTDKRVMDNMLAEESSHTVRDYCDNIQTEVAPHMRKIVTDWMLEVCEDQHCQSEVFFLAVNYLDRFLSLVNIKKTQFQLVASVCILLASKFSQVVPISSEQLVIYTDNSVSLVELKEWELYVLSVLQWELSTATAHSFLQHFCNNIHSNNNVRRQAETIAALASTEYEFIQTKQSVIAAAALAAALKEELHSSEEVVNLLQNVATNMKTDLDEIYLVMYLIINLRSHVTHTSDKLSQAEERPTTPDDVLNISQNEIIV